MAALGTVVNDAQAVEGPYEVRTGSYMLPGRDEPLVATDRKVDLWAEVYRPKTLKGKPFPILVFLHGNHGTCGTYDPVRRVRVDNRSDYTRTGVCPENYVITPNHLGYAYLAEELASWGYVVVSINANRGVTAGTGLTEDRGLNLMRGRLILRHLALLSDWNSGRGDIAPPKTLGFKPLGTMDFSEVGIMGHSRGGEGARAALQQFRDATSPFPGLIGPMNIKSIFEIGPVDGQTSRVLDANGVNSMILLPSCDGDVYNLQGMKVFDRTFDRAAPFDTTQAFHGTFEVKGANHNAYNTEWQTSDSPGCLGVKNLFPAAGFSKDQKATAFHTMVPFFRATVGKNADPALAAIFDPATTLPATLSDITKYNRGYLPGPNNEKTEMLERFSQESGLSDSGVPTTVTGVTVTNQQASYEHQLGTRVARVTWDESSPSERFFQLNFAGKGQNLTSYKTLAFRASLGCFANICNKKQSKKGEMDFTVALVAADGTLSNELAMVGRTRLSRPVGPAYGTQYLHETLYTVELPLEDFEGVDLGAVAGVRFTFEKKRSGVVNIGTISKSTLPAATGDVDQEPAMAEAETPEAILTASAAPRTTAGADSNRIRIVRASGPSSARSSGGSGDGAVEIVLSTKRPFPFTGALPTLTVGGETVEGGDISVDGKTMTISVPAKDFAKLPDGGEVSLFVQASSPVWKFGKLAK
ncbi:hypothetical protein [Chenggangzhangella methanolivorans]|uniref:Alpha/beta hydrolase n=1 Tax=Chenggangzhangella methanolivorans TaxID=1437009 RepID=A0A9E6REH7_9HYPH|nr:hypothetical protein [Chenggangzhangella methanolivorans]QZN99421.1 hypothetical protein K6K41_22145 [Chenggangzhangella methanolivorans]